MEASDLRLGNIILSPDTGKPVVVELGHLQAIKDGVKFNNKYYEPLVLSPEILEKAGFVERDRALLESYGYRNFIHRNATIQIGPNGIKTWVSNKMDEPVEHIKYLHELQNLYFALTGEELNIEL